MRALRWGVGLLIVLAFSDAAEAQQPAAIASTMRDRFAAAMTMEEFVASDTVKSEQWRNNISRSRPAGRAPGGTAERRQTNWHLLIVAENWCSDAVNTIPYIVTAGEASGRFDVRLLRKADADDLLERHRLEGRAATPLVLLLDEDFRERGVWIERPAALREFIRKGEARFCEDDLKQRVRMWYEADAGASTVREILTLIEAAELK